MSKSLMPFNAVGFLLIVQSLVYDNKPITLQELRDHIEREIVNVPADMCERVLENWLQRIDHCKRACGGHMNEIEIHS